MTWGEITELHPGRFVLVEVIKASSNNRLRQLEVMAVIRRSDIEVVEEFFTDIRQRT